MKHSYIFIESFELKTKLFKICLHTCSLCTELFHVWLSGLYKEGWNANVWPYSEWLCRLLII